ncbi:hypothetical protein WR25_25705 isoform B [Diploscapter pachys]|uniref:EDRF1 N-terminal domain-containing protein n=1 Tax=Diploscapter pachys TaxID=2018661 RepID=A0A2A2LXR3_9BILA|nr:hypothetical protein WR25_25705 isoform B [Diploscapter pachys]
MEDDEEKHRRSPPTLQEFEDIDQTLFDLRDDNSIVALIAPRNCDLLLPPSQKWYDENKYKKFFSYERFFGSTYPTSLDLGEAFVSNSFMPVNIVGSQTSIKKILMVPFSATPVSMICHRVGETIYLDKKDFSLQDTRMISDSLKLEHEPNLSLTMAPLPYNSMYEHLIWHGAEIAANNSIASDELLLKPRDDLPTDRYGFPRQFNSFAYKVIPENSNGSHEKAHLWEFSGTKWLVDVDIPILGIDFPTVSIKFNEGDRPISFLTGLDIFLDKLICNFEFTIVVHHHSGVITDREVIIGDELPVLKDCEFHPDKLKTVATNIVTFLEQNVMQQGHTYWLYKEANKDELKLYDLTSICPEYACDAQFNPFLTPVVNLLYRIAMRLMLASPDYRSDAVSNVINGLLCSAQEIIKRDKLLEYAALIDYLMSGVYLMYSMEDRETIAAEQAKLVEGLDKCASDFEGTNAYMRKLESYLQTKRLFDAEFRLESIGDKVSTEKPLETRDDHLQFCMHKVVEYCKNALNMCDVIEEQRMGSNQVTLPFTPDGLDDQKAYDELQKKDDPDVALHFLRQCCRLRIAVALCTYSMHTIKQTGETKSDAAELVSDGIEVCDEICRDPDPPKHFVKLAKMARTKLYTYFLLFMISREKERRQKIPNEPYNVNFKFIEQRSVGSVRELISRYDEGRVEERIQVLVKAAEKTRLASRIFKGAELVSISKVASPPIKRIIEGYKTTVAETMYVSERIFLYAVEDANRYFNEEFQKYETSAKTLEDEKQIREKHTLVLTRVKHFDECYDKVDLNLAACLFPHLLSQGRAFSKM